MESTKLMPSQQIDANVVFYPSVPPISLELTSRCNLKCPYCSNSQLDRPPAFIDWALLEKIVDECADGRHDIAALHGTGEPLLWDRLEEAIRLIRKRNAGSGSFATNGTLLSKARVEKLLDAGLKTIRVSLDSLDEKIYKATRGGQLQNVVSNILGLIELAPEDFQITIILMRHKQQAIDDAQVANFYRTFGFHKNVALEIVDNGLMVSAPEDFREHKVKVRHCNRPREWFTITSEGKVSICCSDQNALGVLGDLRHQTIDEIWYSKVNQKTLANIALGRGNCPTVCTEHCWLEKPLLASASDCNKGYLIPFDEAIEEIKGLILAGDFSGAQSMLTALQERDPKSDKLSILIEILGTVSPSMSSIFEQRRQFEELLRQAKAKDQLIQKHHNFAQRLLEELSQRNIELKTKWE